MFLSFFITTCNKRIHISKRRFLSFVLFSVLFVPLLQAREEKTELTAVSDKKTTADSVVVGKVAVDNSDSEEEDVIANNDDEEEVSSRAVLSRDTSVEESDDAAEDDLADQDSLDQDSLNQDSSDQELSGGDAGENQQGAGVAAIAGAFTQLNDLVERMLLYVKEVHKPLIYRIDKEMERYAALKERYESEEENAKTINEIFMVAMGIFSLISAESDYLPSPFFAHMELEDVEEFPTNVPLLEKEFVALVQSEQRAMIEGEQFHKEKRKVVEAIGTMCRVISQIVSNSGLYCHTRQDTFFQALVGYYSAAEKKKMKAVCQQNEARMVGELQSLLIKLQGMTLKLDSIDIKNKQVYNETIATALEEILITIAYIESLISLDFSEGVSSKMVQEKKAGLEKLIAASITKGAKKRGDKKEQYIACIVQLTHLIAEKEKKYLIPLYRRLYKWGHGHLVSFFESGKWAKTLKGILSPKSIGFFLAWRSVHDYFFFDETTLGAGEDVSLIAKFGRGATLLFQTGIKLFNGYGDGTREERVSERAAECHAVFSKAFGYDGDRVFSGKGSMDTVLTYAKMAQLGTRQTHCMNDKGRFEAEKAKNEQNPKRVAELTEQIAGCNQQLNDIKKEQEKFCEKYGLRQTVIFDHISRTPGSGGELVMHQNQLRKDAFEKFDSSGRICAIIDQSYRSIKNAANECAERMRMGMMGRMLVSAVAAMAYTFPLVKFEEATGIFHRLQGIFSDIHLTILGEQRDNAIDFNNTKHSEYTLDSPIFDNLRARGDLNFGYMMVDCIINPYGHSGDVPRVIMLSGPSGSGKTTIAKAVGQTVANLAINGAKVQFIELDPKHLHMTDIGSDGREHKIDIFQIIDGLIEESRNSATPTFYIIYLDEVHFFFKEETVVADMLKLFTNLKMKQTGSPYGVYVIASTNKPEFVPYEIFENPDRIGLKITIPYPNFNERVVIMKNYLKQFGIPIDHINFEKISLVLDSVSLLEEQVSQGKLIAILKLAMANARLKHRVINDDCIYEAINTLIRRIIPDDTALDDRALAAVATYYGAQSATALVVSSLITFNAATVYQIMRRIEPKSHDLMYARPEKVVDRFGKTFFINKQSNVDLISLEKTVDEVLLYISGFVYWREMNRNVAKGEEISIVPQLTLDKNAAFLSAYKFAWCFDNNFIEVETQAYRFDGAVSRDHIMQQAKKVMVDEQKVLAQSKAAQRAAALIALCEEYLVALIREKDSSYVQLSRSCSDLLKTKKYIDESTIQNDVMVQGIITKEKERIVALKEKLLEKVRALFV